MSIWSRVIQTSCQLCDVLIFMENSGGQQVLDFLPTFYSQEMNCASQVLSKEKNLEIKALLLLLMGIHLIRYS